MKFPDILAGKDFQEIVKATAGAHRCNRPVIVALGGAVIKTGCGKHLIKLVNAGIITNVVTTGCVLIHDLEIAHFNNTSEILSFNGSFPKNVEIPTRLNDFVNKEERTRERGLGEIIFKNLNIKEAGFSIDSLLCACKKKGVPLTVHVGIGTDTTVMLPNYDGAAWGRASFKDFQRLTGFVGDLTEGIWFNIGSAVQLPEIFLKVLNKSYREGYKPSNFTTVNMDFIKHYRPSTRVLQAAESLGGKSYNLIGHHEIMIPLLVQAILEKI